MPLWVGIIALFVALPGSINALVGLYDRFLADRERGPMPPLAGPASRWSLRLFNLISLALLVVVVIATWFPPKTPPTQGSPPETPVIAPQLGRISWLNLYNALKEPPQSIKQQPPKNFVLISQPAENVQIGRDLRTLFLSTFLQSNIRPLNLPNYDLDLDAPKFEGKGLQGITIHGRNAVADFLALTLQHCYQIYQTEEMPPGVADYYRRRYAGTIAVNDVFVWLEVGKGLPFQDGLCLGMGN